MIAQQCREPELSSLTRPATRSVEITITIALEAGLSAREVVRRIGLGQRAGEVGARVAAFYLVDMAERGLHQELGYRSVEMFAEMRFGMAPSTTREHLAVGRGLQTLPETDRAFAAEKLLWSQVRLVVRIATPETEAAWIAWAGDRTVRELACQVRNREKGDLPTDPQKRRIHTTHFTIQGRVNALQLELWNNARAKLEAETGRPVSDTELMLELANLLLSTRPDGSVPGRRPVNDSHFKVVVSHDEAAGTTAVQTPDGPVELDDDTARAVLGLDARASRDAADADDADENRGSEVPPQERDPPTSPALLAAILARDGYRCLCCNGKKNLTGHHKKWRRYGGRTIPKNVMTLCEDCHSLVHDRQIAIRGTVPDRLRFFGPEGRELVRPAERSGLEAVPADARASTVSCVEFRDLPGEVDMDWWDRHRHLFGWSEQRGLEFRPGRPQTPEPAENDARAAPAGRLADLVGHERIRRNLERSARAARKSGRRAPHILLAGPSGLGKTALARAMAGELRRPFRATSGPAIDQIGVLIRLLTTLADCEVVFVDELHRMPARVCEMLYEAMEDGALSLPVTCGSRATTLRIRLRPFTLVGATSQVDRLPQPFHSRFVFREHVSFYSIGEITAILRRAARRDGLELSPGAARRLALAAREIPREAVGLLVAVREEALLRGCVAIDDATAADVLDRLGIDPEGLTPQERQLLSALAEARRPLGRKTLARRLGVSPGVLEEAYEAYPARRGLVEFTRYGRVLARGPRAMQRRPAA